MDAFGELPRSTYDLFPIFLSEQILLFSTWFPLQRVELDGSTGLVVEHKLQSAEGKKEKLFKNVHYYFCAFVHLHLVVFLAWCVQLHRAHHTWSEYWTWSEVIGCCQRFVVGFIAHSLAWNVLKQRINNNNNRTEPRWISLTNYVIVCAERMKPANQPK